MHRAWICVVSKPWVIRKKRKKNSESSSAHPSGQRRLQVFFVINTYSSPWQYLQTFYEEWFQLLLLSGVLQPLLCNSEGAAILPWCIQFEKYTSTFRSVYCWTFKSDNVQAPAAGFHSTEGSLQGCSAWLWRKGLLRWKAHILPFNSPRLILQTPDSIIDVSLWFDRFLTDSHWVREWKSSFFNVFTYVGRKFQLI